MVGDGGRHCTGITGKFCQYVMVGLGLGLGLGLDGGRHHRKVLPIRDGVVVVPLPRILQALEVALNTLLSRCDVAFDGRDMDMIRVRVRSSRYNRCNPRNSGTHFN